MIVSIRIKDKKVKAAIKLRGKLLLIVVGVISAALATYTYLNIKDFSRLYQKNVEERIFAQMNELELMIDDIMELGLSLGELKGLDKECSILTSNIPYARYCFVMDSEGTVYYRDNNTDFKIMPAESVMRNILESYDHLTQYYRTADNEWMYNFSAPVINNAGKIDAIVCVGVASGIIKDAIERQVERALLLGVLFILVAVTGVFLLFHFNILIPIRSLIKGVKEFGRGRLNYRVDVKTGDEIGELTKSSNRMAEDLQKSTVSIDVLQKEQERFKQVAESAEEWIWELDPNGLLVYSNPTIENVIGYKPEEVVEKMHFYDFSPPDKRQELKERVFKWFENREPIKNLTAEYLNKNGDKIILETNGFPVIDSGDKLSGYRGTVKNITERKRAEEELRQSKQRLDMALYGGDLGTWDWDLKTDNIIFSDRWTEMLGYKLEEIKPHLDSWKRLVHPDDFPGVNKVLMDYLEGRSDSYEAEFRMKHKSGQWRWILDKGKIIERDKKGKPLRACGTHFDITDMKKADFELKEAYEKLKKAQSQLVYAEKMEAIARMASGVAHEVKNPLGIILQGINYYERVIPRENKDEIEMLDMMKKGVNRADNIISALLDFSKPGDTAFKREDINSIIDNSLALVRHRSNLKNIKISTNLKQDIPGVAVDRGKVEQVFVNLLNNALDATSEGGSIYIRTYLTTFDMPRRAAGNRSTDIFKLGEEAVVVEIEDTGTGIDESIINKLFDPFFTTKSRTEGTGLGLSIVKNIIDMHKALIDVESARDKGTKFTLIFKTYKNIS